MDPSLSLARYQGDSITHILHSRRPIFGRMCHNCLVDQPTHGPFKVISIVREGLLELRRCQGSTKYRTEHVEWCHAIGELRGSIRVYLYIIISTRGLGLRAINARILPIPRVEIVLIFTLVWTPKLFWAGRVDGVEGTR